MSQQSIEQQVADALLQQSFEVEIDGKKYLFHKLSARNRIEISRYSAQLPDIDEEELNGMDKLSLAVKYGEYADILMKIFAIASNPKTSWPILRKQRIAWKQKKIYNALMNSQMNFFELYTLYKKIAEQIAPAFFLNIISSLKGTNHLKPTRETDPTVPGH